MAFYCCSFFVNRESVLSNHTGDIDYYRMLCYTFGIDDDFLNKER